MKIKFVQDFVGRETAMKLVSAGTVTDAPVSTALELIKLGVAEEVDVVTAPFEQPQPARFTRSKRKERKEEADD